MRISRYKIKKVLIGAGVAIGAVGAGYLGYKGAKRIHKSIDNHNMAKENSIDNIAPNYFEPRSAKPKEERFINHIMKEYEENGGYF